MMAMLSRHVPEVLTVVGYNHEDMLHICRDAQNQERRIDLHVGCDQDGNKLPLGADLIGCKVEIAGTQAYTEIAAYPTRIVATSEPTQEPHTQRMVGCPACFSYELDKSVGCEDCRGTGLVPWDGSVAAKPQEVPRAD